jgi:tRNA G10  N-methylase Trm11
MARYALLIQPAANRVYSGASAALTQAELAVFSQSVLGGRLGELSADTIGGVPYVTFTADGFGEQDAALLANLSSAFSRSMLGRSFAVLDPLCGRGTTLSQALMYGFGAAGIDLDRKDFDAYSAFIQTWLKRKRVKHHAEHGPLRLGGKVAGRRLRISLAAAKEDYKAGVTQHLDLVNADTTRALEFLRPESFDLVVADAPYGVQHGSRRPRAGLERSPLGLLAEAVPVWARLLRRGGACGIAWNTLVARRDAAAAILAGARLDPVDSGPYLAFRHRVDQAIVRDILVARKP